MIVAIEGGDQAGKGTQTKLLEDALKKKNITTTTFSFPDYSTKSGKEISLYLQGKKKFSPEDFHRLMAENRLEKKNEITKAKLENQVVIMNRYSYSNLVYGKVHKLNESWLEELDKDLPEADLVIILDIDVEESFRRNNTNRDIFENDKEFLKKILETYRDIADRNNWKKISASRTKQEIHQDILKLCEEKIS